MADNAPEQIIINGQEFSMEDASRLIDLGKGREEIEKQLNTSIDKVYPEFTKTTQQNKALTQELAEKTQIIEDFQKKQEAGIETPKDVQEALKAAREIGLVDKDALKEQGYLTKDEVEDYFNQRLTQQQNAQILLDQCGKLEKEIDGKDGRVPFDTDAVLSYMTAKGSVGTNFATPLEAYNALNKKGNVKWEEAELAKQERPGLTTLKSGGKKAPVPDKVTFDNFGDKFRELMGSGEPE